MDNKSLQALGEQYFFLKLNFEELRAKCETPQERQELTKKFATSESNFDDAINRVFDQNNAQVKVLITDLTDNTKEIKKALAQDKKMVAILQTITTGVKLGGDLIALGRPSS